MDTNKSNGQGSNREAMLVQEASSDASFTDRVEKTQTTLDPHHEEDLITFDIEYESSADEHVRLPSGRTVVEELAVLDNANNLDTPEGLDAYGNFVSCMNETLRLSLPETIPNYVNNALVQSAEGDLRGDEKLDALIATLRGTAAALREKTVALGKIASELGREEIKGKKMVKAYTNASSANVQGNLLRKRRHRRT